jgi:predicted sulfurtransferase
LQGFNSTLTGNYQTVRKFTAALREFAPETFGHTDFKYVDNLPDNQMLKGLKVWPVTEIVTYGFDAKDAPLDSRGMGLFVLYVLLYLFTPVHFVCLFVFFVFCNIVIVDIY